MICTVDPGIDGALLLLNDAADRVVDGVVMPVDKVDRPGKTKKGNKITRHLLDGPGVRALLQKWAPAHVILEVQGARPEQGLASTATTMRQYGLLEGIIVGLGIPYSLVRPQAWRRAVEAPGGKVGSWIACGKLAPAVRADLERRFTNKASRIAAADAWGMGWCRATEAPAAPKTRSRRPPTLTNDEFFA